MQPFEALRIARERGLDLVEVSPNAVPPVCRIQDYGRYLYEKEKSERAARKKQKVITIKEVKFSVTVDEHDYQTKKNQAVRFLHEGDKVKASLRFRGRQMAHRELGYAIINRLIQDIGEAGVVEFMPRMEQLGRELAIAEHAIKVFMEGDIRGHLVFQLSRLVDLGLQAARRALQLPPWEAIVPGEAVGTLVKAADLMEVYRLAQANDAQFESAGFALEAARQKVPQAFSALLPVLGVSGAAGGTHGTSVYSGTPE